MEEEVENTTEIKALLQKILNCTSSNEIDEIMLTWKVKST